MVSGFGSTHHAAVQCGSHSKEESILPIHAEHSSWLVKERGRETERERERERVTLNHAVKWLLCQSDDLRLLHLGLERDHKLADGPGFRVMHACRPTFQLSYTSNHPACQEASLAHPGRFGRMLTPLNNFKLHFSGDTKETISSRRENNNNNFQEARSSTTQLSVTTEKQTNKAKQPTSIIILILFCLTSAFLNNNLHLPHHHQHHHQYQHHSAS